jgi:regulatory protein
MEIAVRFLGTRPRTHWELTRRLRRGGAAPEVIDGTLERLAELGYVDDLAFARWWMEERDRHAPRGRRLVEAELRQRGVQREVIESLRGEEPEPAPNRPDAESLPSTEGDRARIALERHLRGRSLPTDQRAMQRVGMFLVRRGFDPETVRRALREAADSNDGGDEPVEDD